MPALARVWCLACLIHVGTERTWAPTIIMPTQNGSSGRSESWSHFPRLTQLVSCWFGAQEALNPADGTLWNQWHALPHQPSSLWGFELPAQKHACQWAGYLDCQSSCLLVPKYRRPWIMSGVSLCAWLLGLPYAPAACVFSCRSFS